VADDAVTLVVETLLTVGAVVSPPPAVAVVNVASVLNAVLPEASVLLTRKWYVVLADKPDKGTP
jgi:hypothetical protein